MVVLAVLGVLVYLSIGRGIQSDLDDSEFCKEVSCFCCVGLCYGFSKLGV